jgi:hypothetical protein
MSNKLFYVNDVPAMQSYGPFAGRTHAVDYAIDISLNSDCVSEDCMFNLQTEKDMTDGDESFEAIESVLAPRESIDQSHHREYVERAIAAGHDPMPFGTWMRFGRPTR